MQNLFLEHQGVKLFHITKDGNKLSYWYSLLPDRDESDPNIVDEEQFDFDVRAVAKELNIELTGDNHTDVLRKAIDSKIIKPRRVFYL